MEPNRELSKSPSFVSKSLLLFVCALVGIFGVFFCLWKQLHLAVPGFLLLEATSITLLNLYVYEMKGTLFTKFNRSRLKCVLVCAIITFLSTFAYSAFLLGLAISNNEEFSIENDGSYFGFVPSLISTFWSALLIYESRRFIGMFDEQYGVSNLPYR